MKRLIFAFLLAAGVGFAQDAELTNYKNGISAVWGAGDGSDKGTAYMEEYYFSDKLINDTKVVFIRDTTTITMAHNANNLAAYGGYGYRGRREIGARGLDGDPPRSIVTTVVGSTDVFTSVGHGLTNDMALRFVSGTGGGVLNTAQVYYVKNATADTFQVSSTGTSTVVNIASDGTANFLFDDEGVIRYEIDRLWNKVRKWSGGASTPRKFEYTAPFTLGGSTYDGSTPVVGATGGNGYAQTDKTNFYWRGLTETVGTGTEEYHILMVADDDYWLLNSNDSCASDGKYYVLVVNPITPAMTVRATGEGKFYTTPAWTYWVPKIHAQTTYFEKASGTGTVTFELKNIYGGNISYRINGGSTVDVGAATVTLSGTDFPNGTSTLEYWYTATPTVIRTRTMVKNPDYPSAGETHGNLLWPESYWDQVPSRVTRSPYKGTWNDRVRAKLWEIYPAWDAVKRTGKKLAVTNTLPANLQNSSMCWQAMFAKCYGFTAINSGATQSYAAYAKEMLMESPLNQHPVGMEADNWPSEPIPCSDLVYRGYWDAYIARDAAVAYDILISGFRSDQVSGGITPVEDYFLRDMLAKWENWAALAKGGFCNPTEGGMWVLARESGAVMIAAVLRSYSTPYYGTSGFDGNTTVYQWAPFETNNYPWKKMFLTEEYTLATYPNGPILPIGLEGQYPSPLGMVSYPGTPILSGAHEALWGDKLDYSSQSQMMQWIEMYANMYALYYPSSHPVLDEFFNQCSTYALYGTKNSTAQEGGIVVGLGPVFRSLPSLYNPLHPSVAAAGHSASLAYPANDGRSVSESMSFNPMGVVYYDDAYFGGADVTIPTVTITGPTSSPTYDTTTGILTLSGTASDNVSVVLVSWSNDRGGGGTATGTTSWTIPLIALEGANVITVRSQDSSGNLSTPDTIAVTYTPPVDTPPGSSTTTHTNPRNRRLFGR